MSNSEKIGYLMNAPRMSAIGRIERGDFDGEDEQVVLQLYRLAYESEDMAQSAASAALARKLDRLAKQKG